MDINHQQLAELLFPHVTETPEDLEAKFPPRQLPEGAKVTRFAPSPTGFVHFGGLFPVMVCERLAHQSGGVFYLRIEDTDAKREVPGAAEGLIKTLEHYGIHFDEGAILGPNGKVQDTGIYGTFYIDNSEEGKKAGELVKDCLTPCVFGSSQLYLQLFEDDYPSYIFALSDKYTVEELKQYFDALTIK